MSDHGKDPAGLACVHAAPVDIAAPVFRVAKVDTPVDVAPVAPIAVTATSGEVL